MTQPTSSDLRAQIHHAFAGVSMPSNIDEMLLPPYRSSEDAYAMAQAFVGKPWAELPIVDLFVHREMLATLSAVAYRACLPAYLLSCLATEDWFDKYGADLRGYLVMGLAVRPHHDEVRASTTRERLSLLDQGQREVVASMLRHLETRWRMKEAGEVLRGWR